MKKCLKIISKILIIFLALLLFLFALFSLVPIKTTMISHRGYSSKAPENTLSAFKMSAEKGYKYVECDVKFTKDGVPVLLHDNTVARTANVKNENNIQNLTYDQLLEYDFGYKDKFGDKYKNEKIPTFYQFVDLCNEYDLHPYIEIKSQGGNKDLIAEKIKLLVNFANENLKTSATWISFNYDVLVKIKNLDDTARLGYITNEITNDTITQALELKTSKNNVFINANFGYLTPKKIRLVKKAGIGLEAWTLNVKAIAFILSPFVDGITTDKIINK